MDIRTVALLGITTGAMIGSLLAQRATPTRASAESQIDSSEGQALDRVGFYDRRGRGFGAFAERRDISRWRAHTLSDLLRHLPGVRVISNPQYGRLTPQVDQRPHLLEIRGCRNVLFFLNGASLGTSGDTQFDVDLVAWPQDIVAVEAYRGPSETPLEFNTMGTECGVVLLWTA